MTQEQNKKAQEYATKLVGMISEILDENSESVFKIDSKEFEEGDNLTHFIHALTNIMPTYIYGYFTKEDVSLLDFNHIANHLVFQYSKIEQ